MRCQRCGVEMPGNRGAYRWRSEVFALGEDSLCPSGEEEQDLGETRARLLAELAALSPEENEADVYQLWEGVVCRFCRFELGRIMGMFLNHGK